ncbi:hypothetical protein ACFOTA_06785 [Chitinophaga sp. GCM10012297]|uniref:Recombinase n=1 Tax=Chitinophaga chungangae TaxID=2821488 RepID=A0ABS3YB83_9BACT|nr:hypothetical protein [Chitinophaga chungangae]MBO9151906.1 hypothetical protein [Chitinophaga chungangae]
MSESVCHIENGQIKNPTDIRKQFSGLKDGTYLVKVSARKVRSLHQNAYYWGVVCDMVKDGLIEAGFAEVSSPDDAHEVLKGLFLKREIVSLETGEVLTGSKSTTELTTLEFNTYIEKIQHWAAEYLGISIPSPNEN